MTASARSSLATVLAILVLSGCGEPTCETCGPGAAAGMGATTTGPECHDTHGTLAGSVYRYAAPGDPNSAPAPNAIVLLQHTPTDTPLQGMADADGHFAIELEGGDWIVGGQQDNCSAGMTTAVTVRPCATEQLDIVLDLCTK